MHPMERPVPLIERWWCSHCYVWIEEDKTVADPNGVINNPCCPHCCSIVSKNPNLKRCRECNVEITDMQRHGNRYPPHNLCWNCWRKSRLYQQLSKSTFLCGDCGTHYMTSDWENPEYHDALLRNICPKCQGQLYNTVHI